MKEKKIQIKSLKKYFLGSVLAMLCAFTSQAQTDSTNIDESIFDMSLEEIMALTVSSSSLTEVKNNLTAVPVTIISSRDIEISGARNLDELLEIYIPTFVMMYKGGTSNSIGARGIISDKNDKVLLLVNGKIMNARYSMGAYSERFLSMLGDIEKIEVIESPQSSLYGPGGISMIINIFTKNGLTDGPSNEVEVNQGVIDQFTNVQLRHSNKVNDKLSYSVYYGVDIADGATQKNSPVKFPFDGNYRRFDDTLIADKAITYPVHDLNSSNSTFRHKAHAEINYDDWNAWVRYTNAGINVTASQQAILGQYSDSLLHGEFDYEHLTAFTSYKKTFREKFGLDARLSYDKLNTITYNNRSTPSADIEEDEIYSRLIFSYNTDKIGIAVGPAMSFENFNRAKDTTEWNTNMISGIGEFQYLLMDNLSFVAGVRVDKHTNTDYLFSPKGALVWKPFENQLLRFQYSTSTRRADDRELKAQYDENPDGNGGSESINFYELSGDLQLVEKIRILPSIYYGDYDLIAFNNSLRETKNLGVLTYAGIGASAIYSADKHHLQLSHNFVRPLDLKFDEPELTKNNNVTTQPYGYGNSFHNYHDHISKAVYRYDLNDKMTISASLQVFWGLPGAEDAATHNADSLNNTNANVRMDGSKKPFETSAYLHMGYIYDITPKLTASIFAYNVLGILNEDLNKRVEFQRNSQYRIQPTSFKINLGYRF